MLREMRDEDQAAASASFAAFLAGLAEPDGEEEIRAAGAEDHWDCDGLAEDEATISGVKPPARDSGAVPAIETVRDVKETVGDGQVKRRKASVTIRMTHAESEQLHERASAAGLTTSAYLRSCVFEAEALRTQVKEALAEFSAATAAAERTRATRAARAEDAPEATRGHGVAGPPAGLRAGLKARIFSRLAGHRDAIPI